jgi:hypothetical protein
VGHRKQDLRREVAMPDGQEDALYRAKLLAH